MDLEIHTLADYAQWRKELIASLEAAYRRMDKVDRMRTKSLIGAPIYDRETGKPFESFEAVLEVLADSALETLRREFKSWGFL